MSVVLRTLGLNTVHLFACEESVLHYGVQKRKLAVQHVIFLLEFSHVLKQNK